MNIQSIRIIDFNKLIAVNMKISGHEQHVKGQNTVIIDEHDHAYVVNCR